MNNFVEKNADFGCKLNRIPNIIEFHLCRDFQRVFLSQNRKKHHTEICTERQIDINTFYLK